MAKDYYFISIDIGTQGIKTALVSPDGTIFHTAFSKSVFLQKSDGTIQQCPDVIYTAVLSTVKEVMDASGISANQVLAVGIDGMMAGIVGIDEGWEPVFPYDSGLDKRCESVIVTMQAMGEEEVVKRCGSPIIVAQGAKIFWWQHNYPDLCQNVKKYLPISAYVIGKMGGLKAQDSFIDYTHIHFTCVADVRQNDWSPELTKLFGVEIDKLPRICNPWDVVAKVSGTCARQTGLLAGTPIVAGCGDTAASIFGAGIVQPGMGLDIVGTASVLTVCVDRYCPDIQNKMIIYPRAVMPGQWTPFVVVLGGHCLEWYKNQIDPTDPDMLKKLDNEALEVVNDNLYFLPYLAGRMCPSEPWLNGTWAGMQFHHTRANLHLSIMESIGFEYKAYIDKINLLVSDIGISGITAIGGGAGARLFSKIKCDVLGIPYRIGTQKHTSLPAMMIIAGYGIGYFPDLSQATASLYKESEAIEPTQEAHINMNRRYKNYQKLIENMRGYYSQNVVK